MACPPAVQGVLTRVDGVEACNVDYGSSTATVTVRNDVDAERLAQAFEGSRFKATVKQ